ncbi:MAG: C39 family peptidase, partial [Sarcina sp.]
IYLSVLERIKLMRSKRKGRNKRFNSIKFLIIFAMVICVTKGIKIIIKSKTTETVTFKHVKTKDLQEKVTQCNDIDKEKIKNESDSSIFASTIKEESIRYYAQDDPRYSSLPYTNSRMNDSSQTIETSGCGPSAYSIVVSTLNNMDISPPELCKYSLEIGTRTNNAGTDKRFFLTAATDPNKENYNLNYEKVDSLEKVKSLLDDNKHLIIANMAPGHVTKEGHYIVLSGYVKVNEDTYFKVYDPHSVNEYYVYDGSIIDDEKDDGFILLNERVIKNECQGYYAFSSKNDIKVIKSMDKAVDES